MARASEHEDPARQDGLVQVVAGSRTLLRAKAPRLARLSPTRLAAWVGHVPQSRRERHGRATIEFATNRKALLAGVRRALRRGGGTVELPERRIAASIRLPLVKQALRNNCESAALSMMLRMKGVAADQLRLQAQLPRSGPLDPALGGRVPVWGDPDEGYVGRADGGGASGGYGVHQAPIQRLASRHGVSLAGVPADPRGLYRRLFNGRAVMAWIGLSDGPFMTWRTPSGRQIRANFGEHTVVLTGVSGDSVFVNDPLSGQRLVWSRPQFETMWRRLGRRALST